MVEPLVARAERPAHAGDPEAPGNAADRRQQGETPERHAGDPGWDRDERANDRRHAPDADRPDAPPVEPALGAVEVLRPEVEPASLALDQRPPAVVADRTSRSPSPRCSRRLPPATWRQRPRSGNRCASRKGQRAGRRTRSTARAPGVEHHELARGREDRVEQHQEEDRVEAVVTDERRQGGGDRGQQHRRSCTPGASGGRDGR